VTHNESAPYTPTLEEVQRLQAEVEFWKDRTETLAGHLTAAAITAAVQSWPGDNVVTKVTEQSLIDHLVVTLLPAKGRYYPEMPPALPGETDAQYTDRLTGADRTDRRPYDHPRYRQCSIGYHDECSQRHAGEGDCACPCHTAKPPERRHDDPAVFAVLDADDTTVGHGVAFDDGTSAYHENDGDYAAFRVQELTRLRRELAEASHHIVWLAS
jgi:hypothetical protein